MESKQKAENQKQAAARSPMERRTLLSLAVAASAGAVLPTALEAQQEDDAHSEANKTVLDRATNYGGKLKPDPKDVRQKRIWSASQAHKRKRNEWFDKLRAISPSDYRAIEDDEDLGNRQVHKGTKRPPASPPAPRRRYTNTITSARLAGQPHAGNESQFDIARQRISDWMLEIERKALFCGWQVGYREGYCAAKKEVAGTECTAAEWQDLEVPVDKDSLLYKIEDYCGDFASYPDGWFDRDLQLGGLVVGHESY